MKAAGFPVLFVNGCRDGKIVMSKWPLLRLAARGTRIVARVARTISLRLVAGWSVGSWFGELSALASFINASALSPW